MTDQVRVVHVHHHHRPRRRFRPVRSVWRAVGGVPGGRLVRNTVVVASVWSALHVLPGDQPWVPFADYACGQAPDGLFGEAAWVGAALVDLNTSPPDPGVIAGWMRSAGEKAGEVWAGFEHGYKTRDIPLAPLPDPDPGTVPTGNSGCGGCPGGGDVPVTATDGALKAAELALNVGLVGEPAAIAVAVAHAESGFQSIRSPMNSNGTYDHGYWQINSVHADLLGRYDWRDPADNAAMMYAISHGGTDWSPWTTFRDGAYTTHLEEARAAVAQASGSGVATVAATTQGAGITDAAGGSSQPPAVAAAAFVRDHWGYTGVIYGYSYRNIAGTNTLSEHALGLAIDVMMPLGTDADEVADYFAGPGYGPFGVVNVIHNHRIYNTGRGWHDYTGEDPHTSHVHIDFKASGGTGDVPSGNTGSGSCGVAPVSAS